MTTGSAARLIDAAALSGRFGFVVAEPEGGTVLEAVLPDLPMPPASVTKAVTAAYAIEALGSEHRYVTRLLIDGPVVDGVLQGNLILAGGGDPNLVTDQLGILADRMHATGLREIRGKFHVWDDALFNLDEIDQTQLDHAGYNPTVSGLNLNFNRVHFEWKRVGTSSFETAIDARSETQRPKVASTRVQIVDRSSPIFTYRQSGETDEWTVARSALNNAGSRWLPVRNPARYTGEVFAYFARERGIALTPPTETSNIANSNELVRFSSDPLGQMMRGMLRFSTNLTAEAAGLSATEAMAGHRRGLRTSALTMARWAEGRAGISAHFVDHSGLGDESRMTAAQMVQFLTAEGIQRRLRPILKDIPMVGRDRKAIPSMAGRVQAKTGTLNFVSSLAGYFQTLSGRTLAFAFFGADLSAREAGKRSGEEAPRGAASWNTRTKALQQQLLQNWIRWG